MSPTKSLRARVAVVVIAVMCAALAVPALAGAQSANPTKQQYDNTLTQIRSGGPPSSESGQSSGLGGNVGPLPFTGFDVIAMAAVALAVAGLGLALQRAVSRDSSDELGS